VKIIAWTFIPSLFILLLVAVVNFLAYRQVTEELVVQRNRELARLKAWQVSSELQNYIGLLEVLAASMNTPSFPPFMRDQDRTSNESFNAFDGGLVLLNYQGILVDSWPEGDYPVGQDWSHTSVYRQMLVRHNPRSVVSDLDRVGIVGELGIAAAAPVFDQEGRFRGAVVGIFILEPLYSNNFYETISKLRLESRGSAYLVDGNGQVIYHFLVNQIGEDFSGKEIVQEVTAGKVGSLRIRGDQENDIVASFAPVLGTRWGLVSEESWGALASSSQGYMIFLLVLLAAGAVLPTTLATLGVKRITQPILDLTEAAKETAGGHFGRRIAASTGDEVEELAKQFNLMSGQLEESYNNLEKRVASRTRELETLNAVAAVVGKSLDLEEILSSALEKTLEALGIEVGAILVQEEAGWLTLKIHKGLSNTFLEEVRCVPVSTGAAGEAARTGVPVIKYVREYPTGGLKNALDKEGLFLVLSVPLLSKGRVLGVMNLCPHRERLVTEEEMKMLASVGNQVGVAVDNSRLYEEAEKTAAVAERNRLARELHDAVTQTLFSASLIADVLPKIFERNPEEGRRRIEELRQLNRGALAEMRSLLLELRPNALLEAEVGELFRHLCDAFTGRTQIPVRLELDEDCALSADIKVAFYRIAQESLNNIAKHAHARQVSMTLVCLKGGVRLQIKDDGIGFDLAIIPLDHFGVGIMRERAQAIGGQISIESEPGHGTTIIVQWVGEKENQEKAYG
jgi:nitrate/nitrite-specific signal transduction histidine kinase